MWAAAGVMAPFNWFKRQFNDQDDQSISETSSAEAGVEEQASPPQLDPEQQIESASESASVSQDQLNWAKAAYENIRKRQQTEPTVAPPVAEPTPDTAPSDTTAEPGSESIPESISESVSEPESAPSIPAPVAAEPATAPEPDREPVSATSPAPEPESESIASEAELSNALNGLDTAEPVAVAAEAAAEIVVSEPPTPTSPVGQPLWMQAEAERLERLERLKAEAAAAAAPEPMPSVSATAGISVSETVPLPEFMLDEGFLWSAEVLAAQGRRPEDISIEEITWLKRLRQGLDKTRRTLVNQLKAIVGQGPLNQDAVMEIESLLLQADVGIEATDYIIDSLQQRLRQEALPPTEAIAYLKQLLREMLDKPLGESQSYTFAPEKDTFNVWLITGVNGAGKTTTIGKLAHIAKKSGYHCLIAAADTFRAAAVQQVKVWGDRSQVEVIANPGKNTDPAAVVFDAITAAQSRNVELLLVDTAGRLQNKKNLMEELSKIRRIIDKKAPNAQIESLLVLDATLGQNGLRQAEVFSQVAKLSGVVLTKLDGTAKGGIALAVVQQLGLPIRFIGAGEGIEDLRPFSSYEFVEALLSG